MKVKERNTIGHKHARRVKRWMGRLWLGHWYLFGNYVDVIREVGDEDTAFKIIATIEAEYRYRKATLTIACETLKKLSLYNQERNACHETVHIATSGYQSVFDELVSHIAPKLRPTYKAWWNQVDEQTTEHLTNALMQLTGKLPPVRATHAPEVVELKSTDLQGEGEVPQASTLGSRSRPAPGSRQSGQSRRRSPRQDPA